MKKLIIEKTNCTPFIYLNQHDGSFEISGKSLPENTFEFYKPIVKQIAEYLKNPKDETVFKFELIYFNTSSAKIYFEIFEMLHIAYQNGNDICVYWYFDEDDEDILEAGEDFADLAKIPFKFRALECL